MAGGQVAHFGLCTGHLMMLCQNHNQMMFTLEIVAPARWEGLRTACHGQNTAKSLPPYK